MSVRTAAEYGAIGNMRLRAKYPKQTLNAWARRGGRRRNRTLAEIEANTEPKRARPSKNKGTPMAPDTDRPRC